MKIIELREKSNEELARSLQEKRERIDELRFLLPQHKVKNVKELMWIRRDIARILTVCKRDNILL